MTAGATIQDGAIRFYPSKRSAAGWPYLALAELEARTRRDGVQYWHPLGPVETPRVAKGVPASWEREGTAGAGRMLEAYARAPRPWEPVEEWRERIGGGSP